MKTNLLHKPEEERALRTLCVAMAATMCCGEPEAITNIRKIVYTRWGLDGYLAHGVLLADMSDSFAPDTARDITGAVHPSHVLHLHSDNELRDLMRQSGMPEEHLDEALLHNQRGLDHASAALAATHADMPAVVLKEIRTAHTTHTETLEATLSILLRIASDCTVCPECGARPHNQDTK